MTESARIAQERERQERRDREELSMTSWPVSTRRTQEEIEADFVRRSVVCCYCGKRQVPADNECEFCGVKLQKKGVA